MHLFAKKLYVGLTDPCFTSRGHKEKNMIMRLAHLDWLPISLIHVVNEKVLHIGYAIRKCNCTLGAKGVLLGFGLEVARPTMDAHGMFVKRS